MIKKRDVLRIKMPFPNINSALAMQSHMYICREITGQSHSFLKCQTLKPYMLTGTIMRHYWDEQPDIARNPFQHTTRIDCDKLFITQGVIYADQMRTPTRPDVCELTMTQIEQELVCDGFSSCGINEDDVVSLNYLATKAV